MLTELLGIAGTGLVGSVVSLFGTWLEGRREEQRMKVSADASLLAAARGDKLEFIRETKGLIVNSVFAWAFFLITLTIAVVVVRGIFVPGDILYTFKPDPKPIVINLLFFSIEWQREAVYQITTGGVSYACLHALVFMLCNVLTGINPMQADLRAKEQA